MTDEEELKDMFLQAIVDQAQSEQRASDYEADCPWFPELFEQRQDLPHSVWLRRLGLNWTFAPDTTAWREELREAIGGEPLPIEQMMSREELEALEGLPDELTVYRGCGPGNADGICWSLDRSTAAGFPFRGEWPPLLLTGTVARADVIALKLERAENEIISFRVREVRREHQRRPRSRGKTPGFSR